MEGVAFILKHSVWVENFFYYESISSKLSLTYHAFNFKTGNKPLRRFSNYVNFTAYKGKGQKMTMSGWFFDVSHQNEQGLLNI